MGISIQAPKVNYANTLLASMTGSMLGVIAYATVNHVMPVELPMLAVIWLMAAAMNEVHSLMDIRKAQKQKEIDLEETKLNLEHALQLATIQAETAKATATPPLPTVEPTGV